MAERKPQASPSLRELYQLDVWGGAAEARYRRARPDIEALPWTSLDVRGVSDEELIAARRAWTEASLQEYASAATFSLTLRACLRARVPLDLSAMLAQFPLDEIAHAELCARMAAALGGGTPLAYDRRRLFPAPTENEESLEPLQAATERVVFGMCVRESWSHAIINALWKHNQHPLYKQLWKQILDDEKAHAGFGWLYLEWVELDEPARRRVTTMATRAITELRRSLDEVEKMSPARLSRLGIIHSIGRARYLEAARRALEVRVTAPLRRFGFAV